jgi:hypothetical protein
MERKGGLYTRVIADLAVMPALTPPVMGYTSWIYNGRGGP